MGAHVSERADAKRQPAAPVEWMVDRMIRDILGDWSQVQIPVQSRRHWITAERRCEQLVDVAEAEWISEWTGWRRGRRRPGRRRYTLRPIDDRPVGPDVNLAHRAEYSS